MSVFGGNNSAPSGPMLLLKSLGFDPKSIMENIDSAKSTANEVLHHFDKRLQCIELQQEQILVALEELVGRGKVKQ